MAIKHNGKNLIARLSQRFDRIRHDHPALHEAFTRIGILVSAKAKMNLRRKGMIDTGRLINSVRYEIYTKGQSVGVNIGSFGTPYAAIHEFGGEFTNEMRRAMFASLRDRGRLKSNYQPKGVIRDNYIQPRPYLRPAMRSSQNFTVKILAKAMGIDK